MFPTCIPFPSSGDGDKENVPVNRGEKRAKCDALIDGAKTSKRPLLQRVITRGQSITILTNPARAQALAVPPTIHEEVTRSPLSPIHRPSSLSPVSPRPHGILNNPTRASSLPSVRQSRSPPHITILSNPEREKREAHPLSSSSVRQSRSRPYIPILSILKKEKREAHPLLPPSVRQSRSSPHIPILSILKKERREAHPLSPPSVRQSRSSPHITILSNLEKEKRKAHPLSPSPVRHSRSSSHLTILSNLEKEKRKAHLHSLSSVRQSRSSPHITILSNLDKGKRKAHPLSASPVRHSRSSSHLTILSNPEKEKHEAQSHSPSVRQSRSRPHITILSNPEKEKREAHPLSPSSVRQSRSRPHIAILSNLEKEKRKAHLRSIQRTKNIRNSLAGALAHTHVPTVSITPISILKAPTPRPQAPAPAPAPVADPNPDDVKENVKVNSVLSDIIVQEIGQGDHDLETGTGAETTTTSGGEMLGVPLVDWRGRLDENELSRYYPKEHVKEQFVHRLRSMVRSGNRSAAARRRDHARRCKQTATSAPAVTTPPSIAFIVSHP